MLLLKSFCKMLEITNVFLEEGQQSVFFFQKKPDVNVGIWRKDNITGELSQLIYWIITSVLSY